MHRTLLALPLIALSLSACSPASEPSAQEIVAPRNAPIVGADGATIGQATFTEATGGVIIRLEFAQPLPAGWHGLHLHQVGDCSDFAAGFQASGAHLGKHDGVQHGLLNPQGAEAGDLPNLYAPASAPFGAEVFSTFVTLGATGDRAALLDEDGTALLIHAGPDDQTSQPIGGAGDRIACAALTRQ